MKYTVQGLIDRLSLFPRDLVISTDIAMLSEYPDELYELLKDEPDFEDIICEHVTSLYIFEGDWEHGGVSDMNDLLDEVLK